mgnify:CR=1 FL=1
MAGVNYDQKSKPCKAIECKTCGRLYVYSDDRSPAITCDHCGGVEVEFIKEFDYKDYKEIYMPVELAERLEAYRKKLGFANAYQAIDSMLTKFE